MSILMEAELMYLSLIHISHQLGAKCVTCSDSTGWIYDPEGIDVALLTEVKEVKSCLLYTSRCV